MCMLIWVLTVAEGLTLLANLSVVLGCCSLCASPWMHLVDDFLQTSRSFT